ncbi:hypothetical protein RBB79_17895 [Tunturiibacter empetritectus]|uniref:Uncharacterized protein n=1 Tax=Tunturiibacter lichenicola TaxID=2051959 RepID=A0A852VIS6_9BACT|nr:hypothetical protein [Edaphobacter lichenicola]NYF91520.1 hypothetical protein [Edaphobacter lichenicola]
MPLDDSQDLIPPNTVTVSDPVVTGVQPVPDDSNSNSNSNSNEAYSERGLSGEAAPGESLNSKPFMLKKHSDEEIADYDKGFECGQNGGQNDDSKSKAWQQGWAEAQE